MRHDEQKRPPTTTVFGAQVVLSPTGVILDTVIPRALELHEIIRRERALHDKPLQATLVQRADGSAWWSVVPTLRVEDCGEDG